MKFVRKASAAWSGGLEDGKGSITTESGALAAKAKAGCPVSKVLNAEIPLDATLLD